VLAVGVTTVLAFPDLATQITTGVLTAAGAGLSGYLAVTFLKTFANLGWSYADQDQWTSALELFERVVQIRVASAADASTLHCARSDRALALRAIGRHTEALTELRQMAATPEGAADPSIAEEIAASERALSG
jgi:hypothetical protein